MTSTTDTEAITTAVIRFPAPYGPHTYKLGDVVVFINRGHGFSGPITEFERYEGKTYATVSVPEFGSTLIELAKVLFVEHPDAAKMLKPGEHLVCGTLVRVHGLKAGKISEVISNGDLAVVMADKGRLVNVARLGGNGDRYGRLSHDHLTVVKVDPRTGAVTE
jgi:hypothetical protein